MQRFPNPLRVVAVIAAWTAIASAGEADVLSAVLTHVDGDRYRIAVTVRHADEGWDHYADGFDVLGPDGAVLGTRVLRHPHVAEQPFTRELGDLTIPASVREVTVRARDSVHGLGGREVTVPVPLPDREKGTDPSSQPAR